MSVKVASIWAVFRLKGEKSKIKNHLPVSILNCFSKVYERPINEQLMSPVIKFLPDFILAYSNGCSTNHVLLKRFGGLSKACDCISHNLLIKKLHIYGSSFETLTFLNTFESQKKKQLLKVSFSQILIVF